eukprot:COSAG05_NODE_130_length_17165_cov_154.623638_22_plen_81_part_00
MPLTARDMLPCADLSRLRPLSTALTAHPRPGAAHPQIARSTSFYKTLTTTSRQRSSKARSLTAEEESAARLPSFLTQAGG